MEHIAPTHWPPERRQGFCWGSNAPGSNECVMEFGNPANQFWSELGVDKFRNNINFNIDFNEINKWLDYYPAQEYPVLALRGAPASYPIKVKHRDNQKFMVWSDEINVQVDDYLKATFGN